MISIESRKEEKKTPSIVRTVHKASPHTHPLKQVMMSDPNSNDNPSDKSGEDGEPTITAFTITTSTIDGATTAAATTATAPTVDTESTSTNASSQQYEFQDYVPPRAVKILPPAKYKLWILIYVLVYFAEWFSTEAQLFEFLRFDGWLSPNATLFLMLGIIVFVLVYSTLDLLVELLTFRINGGKVYGLGPWLKQPRVKWTQNYENVIVDVIGGIIHILEDGFAMFDAQQSQTQTPQQQSKHQHQHSGQFECQSGTCATTLKIEHRVKPEKLEEYKKWVVKIGRVCRQANGFVCATHTQIMTQRSSSRVGIIDEEEAEEGKGDVVREGHQQQGRQDNDYDIEQGEQDEERDTHHKLQVVYLKFRNVDYLNDWMISPRRNILMKELQDLLVEPDIVQIQLARKLPDAFSDLLTRQGDTSPPKPPLKWKTWWLTVLALYISINWNSSIMPYYYDKWNLTNEIEIRAVSIFVTTFLNSYIMIPFLLFVFNPWVQRRDDHHDNDKDGKNVDTNKNSNNKKKSNNRNNRQPWKTLNDGFTSIWPKLILTIGFYGGCLVAWKIREY